MFKGLINMFSKKETFTEGNEDDPPAVDPPAVDPPVVDPPAVDPPAVDPPAVDPPAVDPPAVDTGNETPETNNEPSKIILALNKFFNKDNLMMLLAFLGIFIVLYIALGIYFRIFGSGSQDSLVSAVNAIVLVAVSILGINKYYHLDNNKKNNLLEHLYTSFKDNIGDMETTFGLIVILGFIIGMQKILHLPTPEGNSSFVLDVSNFLLWVVLLFNIIIICFTDLLNIPVLTIIEDAVNSILYGTVINDDDIQIDSGDDGGSGGISPQPAEEVFNVSNNLYTYEDAPHVCAALGARLASYDEIEGAYNKGADWCSYGWSQNQMGFFPTQKETWQKLQSNNARKNSCGRPGVNGGYIPNSKMRLGVNCYGVKPQASESDLERMATSNIVPRSSKDIVTERKIEFWKENADKMLNLNPHSKGDWSSY